MLHAKKKTVTAMDVFYALGGAKCIRAYGERLLATVALLENIFVLLHKADEYGPFWVHKILLFGLQLYVILEKSKYFVFV